MKINKKKLEEIAEAIDSVELLEMDDEYVNSCFYKTSMKIAAKMRRALRLKEMTQTELSHITGMAPAVISRYLAGKANMELKTIVKIEEALGINIIDRVIAPKIVKKTNVSTQPYNPQKIDVNIHYFFTTHVEKPEKRFVGLNNISSQYNSVVTGKNELAPIVCDTLYFEA